MGFNIVGGELKRYTKEPGVTEVVVPDGVEQIGTGAFWDCSDMRSVTFPESVTRISGLAFYGCSSLTTVIAPGATYICYDAFQKCDKLKMIVSPQKPAANFRGSGTAVKHAALRGWLVHPELFTNETVFEDNKRYMFLQVQRTLPIVYEEDSVSGIKAFAESGRINEKNFYYKFLLPAVNANAVKCVAFLLEWQSEL